MLKRSSDVTRLLSPRPNDEEGKCWEAGRCVELWAEKLWPEVGGELTTNGEGMAACSTMASEQGGF